QRGHLPVCVRHSCRAKSLTCSLFLFSFGEHKGSYCVVAKLRDGRQESYVNDINIDELAQRSLERSKQVDKSPSSSCPFSDTVYAVQSSYDILQSRKNRQAMFPHRSKN